jgi:choline dehydrogenase
VRARREVILSGGAIDSPQLLLLSGVGDGAALAGHGIDVQRHLPAVGRNLQDHLAVSYFYKVRTATLNDELHPLLGKAQAALRFAFDRRGPLSLSVNQSGGFVRSGPDGARCRPPALFQPGELYQDAARGAQAAQSRSVLGASCSRSIPAGRRAAGYLELRSANPLEHPLIQPNYLSTEADIAEVLAGNRLLRRIASSRPLADLITEELIPGPQVVTEEDQLADFRARADTVYHPTGTCAMGPDAADLGGRCAAAGCTASRVCA